MTKDVMIRIKGLQYAEGQESDTTELMLPGQFFERDGLSFVKYDEIVEDDGETIRNLLKFSDTKLTVIRHGAVESSMSFEKGKKLRSLYRTPFGDLEVGTLVSRFLILRTEENIRLEVDYALEMNGAHAAENRIAVTIRSRKNA